MDKMHVFDPYTGETRMVRPGDGYTERLGCSSKHWEVVCVRGDVVQVTDVNGAVAIFKVRGKPHELTAG